MASLPQIRELYEELGEVCLETTKGVGNFSYAFKDRVGRSEAGVPCKWGGDDEAMNSGSFGRDQPPFGIFDCKALLT